MFWLVTPSRDARSTHSKDSRIKLHCVHGPAIINTDTWNLFPCIRDPTMRMPLTRYPRLLRHPRTCLREHREKVSWVSNNILYCLVIGARSTFMKAMAVCLCEINLGSDSFQGVFVYLLYHGAACYKFNTFHFGVCGENEYMNAQNIVRHILLLFP